MKKNQERDFIFARPLTYIPEFTFDENVATVFSDMIQRSVPGYQTLLWMIGLLSKKYVQANSLCYDLGCSLGAVTQTIQNNIHVPNCRIIAVDNSPAMLERCLKFVKSCSSNIPVDMICADIRHVLIRQASFIVLNFTLQFLDPDDRFEFLKRLYSGMVPGGALIISEKITLANKQQNLFQTELHHFFKKAEGYSELEISQKRTALEKVLFPETKEKHLNRLKEAGFHQAELWFQCFNFASFIAIK